MVQQKLLKYLKSCVKFWKTKKWCYWNWWGERHTYRTTYHVETEFQWRDRKTKRICQNYSSTTEWLEDIKAERTEAENSTWVHQDSFEINTEKSQVNESVLVAQLRENCFL